MVKAITESSAKRLIVRLIGGAALYHKSTFPAARFGRSSEDQRLNYCTNPAMEVFEKRLTEFAQNRRSHFASVTLWTCCSFI